LEPKNGGGAERIFRREEEQKWCLGGEKTKGCIRRREYERTLKFKSHPRKPQNLNDEWEG